ncbi:MAG: hypothetical protein A3A33_02940 [Candidatus Yanofskybacteria bacterium RIFCSPLOWO2_01_FULL_49_25]|uniref:Rod shape-determining protein RodA n=1 Tax=Candidatus Yanofskybacteria bacterium RIFCSPLOWO2_01_FULL_49_25 TaxID=1802701 RepID=A0A1F8GW18_9BACT|nr:MAG: hypothetical protein A3A33_02940 [Candidatus Yanofskybacteria bacterium RIFCSPLOWO2_01_FULL_49_25]
MQSDSFVRKFDWVLIGTVLVILGLGLITFWNIGADGARIAQRQMIFIVLGLAVMFVFSFFDYRVFKNYSRPALILYFVALALLSFALATHEIRGASSWLVFFGFRFEPAEFAKLALLILLAKYFSQKHVEIYRSHHIIVSGIYVAIPTVLTLLQPDLGSVIVYLALWLGILLYAGIKRRHLLAILMIGVVVVAVGWFAVLKPYQKDRIVSFANPYLDPRGTGYSTIQSRVTFGSGQITGTLLSSENKNAPVLVPEPYTDFTFASYAQKFGFVGVAILLGLFFVLIYRIGSIGSRADHNFAKLFTLGLITILFVHVVINGGMNMGILPITGIPFPFLSHGGSHLVTLMAALGIVESIRLRSG